MNLYFERHVFLSREDNVRQRVQRIFKIWDERKVYPSAVIAKLNKLLDPSTEDKETPPLPAVKVAAGFKVGFFYSSF